MNSRYRFLSVHSVYMIDFTQSIPSGSILTQSLNMVMFSGHIIVTIIDKTNYLKSIKEKMLKG